ncbi:unnamed protein product [Strongylus vulgaris]|uniref:Uncharacterized protein n=1 Tax=Strongylus vulgaris TaxID=40348 RepID=A0A3P7I7G8_STRVU|nr:unnamed protein product [Strongylus vulgaris]
MGIRQCQRRFQRSVIESSPRMMCAITQLPHVRHPGLCFLQGDYMIIDAPCSEKGVKSGVGGDCPGVVGAEHETISMASH